MAIFERTREIGMLRALGMIDKEIIRLFVTETALIGFLGALMGMALGILINCYMIYIGIDLTEILASANMKDIGYRLTGSFKAAWNWSTIIFSGIGAISWRQRLPIFLLKKQ